MITFKQCRGIGLIIVGLLSSLLSGHSLAESYVYLTNNTLETLTIATKQTGHDNIRHGDEWQQLATQVPPLGTVKFLRFNRDQGIKWGKEYIFTTEVNGASEPLYLKQKLLGTSTFSKMWLSGQDDPWHYDRDIHRVSLVDQQQVLAFKSSSARASGDDIHYVIHEEFIRSEKSQYANELNVLTYNTWALLTPLASKNTGDRLDTIAEYMTHYDVVVFQEVFDPVLTAKFREKVAKTYPYMTDIPWQVGKVLTGGSFIASRWPIEAQDTAVYDACRADGCFASKGMNYAKIRKGSHAYHIFGTHTHAYTSEQDVTVRFEQLAQLKRFIESKQIPYEEPVIMAGDFNVDKIHYPQEHEAFLELLNATEPEATGVYPYSYAGSVNIYADEAFNEYLDYVLYSNGHIAPYASENKMLTPRSIDSQHWQSWDLSDHYPVEGRFAFPLAPEYMLY